MIGKQRLYELKEEEEKAKKPLADVDAVGFERLVHRQIFFHPHLDVIRLGVFLVDVVVEGAAGVGHEHVFEAG